MGSTTYTSSSFTILKFTTSTSISTPISALSISSTTDWSTITDLDGKTYGLLVINSYKSTGTYISMSDNTTFYFKSGTVTATTTSGVITADITRGYPVFANSNARS